MIEFFKALKCENEMLTFQIFADKPNNKNIFPKHFSGSFINLQSKLIKANKYGAGIFFCPQRTDGNGRSNSNILSIRCLYIDLDGAPVAPVFLAKAKPHVVSESSPGRFHAFWLVDNCPLSAFKTAQKKLATIFNSDEKVCDLPRVMRIPGFLHQKNEPFLSRIIQVSDHSSFDFKEFETLMFEESKIEKILKYLSPDDYKEWIEAGFALKNLSNDNLSIWEEWSSKSLKYKEGECAKKWATFNDVPNPITIATLEYRAREQGYVEEVIPLTLKAPKTRKKENLVELIKQIPNCLVTEFAAHITETAIKPQPILSFAASVAAISTVKAHKVQSSSGLRTNLYVLGLAGSGSGKNHPMQKVKQLLHTAQSEQVFAGRPASEQGLLRSIRDANGQCLINWDEIGLDFETITANNAPVHLKSIIRAMMELFSSANSSYIGSECKNQDGRNPTITLDQPCLSVIGMSTHYAFYCALKNSFTATGFLPRWLIFEANEKTIEKRINVPLIDIPTSIIERVKNIRNTTLIIDSLLLSDYTSLKPRIIYHTPEALAALRTYDDKFLRLENGTHEKIRPAWTRATEHAIKLALVLSDEDVIHEDTQVIACKIVESCIKDFIIACDQNISDNVHESDHKKLVKIVYDKKEAGISKSELVQKTRFLSKQVRNSIIESACEGREISFRNEAKADKPTTFFFHVDFL